MLWRKLPHFDLMGMLQNPSLMFHGVGREINNLQVRTERQPPAPASPWPPSSQPPLKKVINKPALQKGKENHLLERGQKAKPRYMAVRISCRPVRSS